MRTLVIGLDCATPQLIFERPEWALPTLRALMARGTYGRLRTVTPAITIPAWACMVTGKDPGELGVYGFRNRSDYSYTGLALTTSRSIREPAVWDRLGEAGKRVIVVGVPPSYPPKPVSGIQVGCFLTPSVASDYTFPANVKEEIAAFLGRDYLTDCTDFRTEDKDDLLRQIYDMTELRFRLLRNWVTSKDWDFFMFVEIGTDRLHHGFWKFFDPMHRAYEAGNRYEGVIRQYYEDLDRMLAGLLERVDVANTNIYAVSDHGAKRMDGGICINEWLIREGYLSLKTRPERITPFAKLDVDWSRTSVWGEGGYYARIFFNVAGREPQGIVAPGEFESLAAEIERKLRAIPRPGGFPMDTQVFRPKDIYRAVRGIAPDLMVYFDDLLWRSVGTVGYDDIYTFENDTGPDDANHAQDGIYIEASAERRGRGMADPQPITSMHDRLLAAAGGFVSV